MAARLMIIRALCFTKPKRAEPVPEGKIGLPRANPRGRLRSPS